MEKKSSGKKPSKKVVKIRPNIPDDEFLPLPDAAAGDEDPLPPTDGDDGRMEGLSQGNRRTEELNAAMQARLHGEAKFPYPPELRDELRPFWLELVNSFPKDHFQASDVPMMKLYCRAAYDIERISLKLDEEGEVVFGPKGNPMVNPRVKVRTDAQNMLLMISTKFRNQPASRTNTENHKNRQGKASAANQAADTLAEDEDSGDSLLAGSTRH
jgi:phage terminase small subunit